MSWNFMTFELLQLTVIESYQFILVPDSELQPYLPFSGSDLSFKIAYYPAETQSLSAVDS